MGPTFYVLTLIAGQTAPAPIYSQPTYSPNGYSANGNCNCGQVESPSGGGLFSRVRGWFRGNGNDHYASGTTYPNSYANGSDRYAERPGLVNRFRDRFGGNDRTFASTGAYPTTGTSAQIGTPMTPAQLGTPLAGSRVSLDSTSEPELARPSVKQTGIVRTPAAPRTQAPRPETTRPETTRTETTRTETTRTETRPSKINPKFENKIGHEEDYSWITGQLDQENGRWLLRYATPDTVDRYSGKIVLAPATNVSQLRPGDLVSATGQVVGQGQSALYRVATITLIERD